jgi:hypothetical protein
LRKGEDVAENHNFASGRGEARRQVRPEIGEDFAFDDDEIMRRRFD